MRPRSHLLVWSAVLLVLSGGGLAYRFATRFDPFGHALSAYNTRDYRSALAAAKTFLKANPRDRAASLMAARCLTHLGKRVEAEPFYAQAHSDDTQDLHDHAFALIQRNEDVAAAEIYEKLQNRDSKDALALTRLAAVRMKLKDWKQVALIAAKLASLPDQYIASQTMSGIAQHELLHYSVAVDANLRVLAADPELASMPLPKTLFWHNLAIELIALGRDPEARQYLERALAKTQDAGLMELLGFSYSQQGDTENAERCWRLAELWEPDNANVCLDLGRLAVSRKDWNQALTYYKRAAAHSTEAVEPLYALSQVYRVLGNQPEADRYKKLADNQRPRRPASRGGMGADTEPTDLVPRSQTQPPVPANGP